MKDAIKPILIVKASPFPSDKDREGFVENLRTLGERAGYEVMLIEVHGFEDPVFQVLSPKHIGRLRLTRKEISTLKKNIGL